VILGVGAAGVAITKILLAAGIGDVVAVDHQGILTAASPDLDEERAWIASHTNLEGRTGGLDEAVDGADVFIGVSGPNLLREEHLALLLLHRGIRFIEGSLRLKNHRFGLLQRCLEILRIH